jgi:hypothetical protein
MRSTWLGTTLQTIKQTPFPTHSTTKENEKRVYIYCPPLPETKKTGDSSSNDFSFLEFQTGNSQNKKCSMNFSKNELTIRSNT